MKRVFVLLLISMNFLLSANATESSKYLTELYTKEYKQPCHIISKQEFIDKYEQKVDNSFVSSIVYGYGYIQLYMVTDI